MAPLTYEPRNLRELRLGVVEYGTPALNNVRLMPNLAHLALLCDSINYNISVCDTSLIVSSSPMSRLLPHRPQVKQHRLSS